jgi:hypothetical protein
VYVAMNSTVALKCEDWPLLAQRLHEDGYLAFSRFFDAAEVTPALEQVKRLRNDGINGFEANLTTGVVVNAQGQRESLDTKQVEHWQQVGRSEAFARLSTHEKLQSVLVNVLKQTGDVHVPDNIEFQLSWVRGKGLGDSTRVHVDYHHVQPNCDDMDNDVLDDVSYKSFNMWTKLSASPSTSSFLAVR